MILQLRLCVQQPIIRRSFLTQNAPVFLNFSTTSYLSMPRKVRLKPEEMLVEEVHIPEYKWNSYAPTKRNPTNDDFIRVTNFGQMRMDGDNAPKLVPETETNLSGGSYTETYSQMNAHKSDYLSLLMEEPVNGLFSPISALVTEKSTNDNESVAKQQFSFGKVRENKTIPVSFESSGKSDLNYIDELMFQESFEKFSPEESNQVREVKVDPSVQVARDQMTDSELNLIDKDYFFAPPSNSNEITQDICDLESIIPEEFSTVASTQKNVQLSESDELNYVDEQFFIPNQKTSNLHPSNSVLHELSSIEIEPEQIKENVSWFENDIRGFDVKVKDETDAELKTKMKAKRAEKRRDAELDGELNESLQTSMDSEVSEKVKIKKSTKRDKAKTSVEGSALDYVRKLRKSQDSTTEKTLNNESTNYQDRFLSATSNLQQSNVDKKVTSGDDDEEEAQHVEIYTDVKKYRPPNLETYIRMEMKELILSKILYNDHDIVAIWKPYGLPMFLKDKNNQPVKPKTSQEKLKNKFSLQCFLPDLAEKLGIETLHEVHRLDSTTTGVVLYAKTKEMEVKLRKLFKEKKVQKSYLCICNGIPKAESGIIDIPVGEGSVGGRIRMTLRPDYRSSKIITNKKTVESNASQAVTEYKVTARHNNASLVHTKMMSGKKHQIRLHLGLGLGCPILGDHKFSYPDQLGKPQKVMGDIVERLNIRKSKSRDLPIFLHARKISIPDILPDGNLVIAANLPHFFTKVMKRLKLRGENRIKN